MRHQTNSYGTNRDNKRIFSSIITGIVTISLISLSACTPVLPINEEEEQGFYGKIEDWPESGDTTAPSDSIRPATHQDSIRLGIIPSDE